MTKQEALTLVAIIRGAWWSEGEDGKRNVLQEWGMTANEAADFLVDEIAKFGVIDKIITKHRGLLKKLAEND